MSTVVKDLGAVSAYAYAVEKGYAGTEAEFAELMADYAEVGQRAEDAANSALESKTAAQTAATTATNKASEATTAAQTATTKAGEASQSATAAAASAASITTPDATLTQAGVAADAKATGDEISDLKEELNTNESILSLSDTVSIPWASAGRGYIDSSGDVINATKYEHTDYINIQSFECLMYKRPGSTAQTPGSYMAFYDHNKTFVDGKRTAKNYEADGYISGYDCIIVPENAVYARFSIFADTETYGSFEIYGHSKASKITSLAEYCNTGYIDITKDFIVSQYTSRLIEPNNKRIVNSMLYNVKAGDKIIYTTGDLLVTFGLYYGNTNALHTIKEYGTVGTTETVYTIPQNGLLAITFKNANETELSIDSFNATVKLKTSYSERYTYEYYGEKIALKGFTSEHVLSLDGTGGNPDDIAIYGDYLVNGVANDILRIYSISNGTKLGELNITNGSHFNVLAFSNVKYNNSDLLPLLYAETEGLNGIYNVIRIISLTEYEIIKKYRFDESTYGLAPQIYFDFANNVAYGVCIPLSGRQPMYDFYKFDLTNETLNEDGTYTPTVLYQGKCPNPRTRQGGACWNGRLYLMTTNASSPFNPQVVVYNVNSLNPEIVSILPNMPFSNEGEGLAITNGGEMYISSVSTVYKLAF